MKVIGSNIRFVINFIFHWSAIKKGDLFSLFFILLFNIGWSQFLINDLLRPVEFSLYDNTSNIESLNMYHHLDIKLIGNNDSTYIVENYTKINQKIQLKSTFLDIQLSSIDNQFKSAEDLWSIYYYEKNKSLSTRFTYKDFKYFTPSLFIQLSSDQNTDISTGVALNHTIDNFTYHIDFKRILSPYELSMQYDDFNYSIDLTTKCNIYDLKTEYDNNLFNVQFSNSSYRTELDRYEMENDSQDFSINYHKYNESELVLLFNLTKSENIFLSFKKTLFKLSADFWQLDENPIHTIETIKINHIELDSRYIKFQYQKSINGNSYTIGFLSNKKYLLGSARIRTSIISNSMESAFGAPIVNNKDGGDIVSSGLFINYKYQINKHNNLLFNAIYLNDDFNITINNTLLSSFGLPLGITNENLDIKHKKAIVLNLELMHRLKKIDLLFSLNQHIPIEIVKSLDNTEIESSYSKEYYGGGLFKFMLTYKI